MNTVIFDTVKTRTTTSVILKLSVYALLSINLTAVCAQAPESRIAGKPTSFYLDHQAITSDAKLLYAGKLTPTDDDRTFAILDSTLTRNREIRPFYFLILNQVIKTSDGALSEYVSAVCSRYVSQYPCEFMQWQADPVYAVDLRAWAGFIAFDLYNVEAFKKYHEHLKTSSCKSPALDHFVNEIRRIVTELNEH